MSFLVAKSRVRRRYGFSGGPPHVTNHIRILQDEAVVKSRIERLPGRLSGCR